MKTPLPKLTARVVRPQSLTASERARLYSILERYYDAVSREQFDRDLDAKHAIILLRDESSRELQGFSTLLKTELRTERGSALGIFSGDTIIEKAYWGQKALGVAFLKYLWRQKLRNPFRPVYWLLISKGYKTYLLMANNFAEHYPRFESETPPPIKKILDAFYETLYPGKYEPTSGRIRFDRCEGKLKQGVADIDPFLLERNPRVAFFAQANPGWSEGDELACLARMTYLMPFKYLLCGFDSFSSCFLF